MTTSATKPNQREAVLDILARCRHLADIADKTKLSTMQSDPEVSERCAVEARFWDAVATAARKLIIQDDPWMMIVALTDKELEDWHNGELALRQASDPA